MRVEICKPGRDFAGERLFFDEATFAFYPDRLTDLPVATVGSITKIEEKVIYYPRRDSFILSALCFFLSLLLYGNLFTLIGTIFLIRGFIVPSGKVDFIVQFADGRSLTGNLEKRAFDTISSVVEQNTSGKTQEDSPDFEALASEGLDKELYLKALAYARENRWVSAVNLKSDFALDTTTARTLYNRLQVDGVIDENGNVKQRE